MSMIKETFRQVKNLFIWQSDQATYNVPEHWTSHADEVERGEVFRDDCDGFSLTCAELLARKGMDKGKIRLAFCLTETGGGHLVCVADDMLLDNRQRSVWHWSQVKYEWISSMRLDEPGIWRQGSTGWLKQNT